MRPIVSEITRYRGTLAALARALGTDKPFAIWNSSDSKHDRGGYSSHAAGRFAYLAVKPRKAVSIKDHQLTITRGEKSVSRPLAANENPLDALTAALDLGAFKDAPEIPPSFGAGESIPFFGGAIGFISYDCGRHFENIRGASGHAHEPDLFFLEANHAVIQDRREELLLLISWPDESDIDSVAEHTALLSKIENCPRAVRVERPRPLQIESEFSREQFVGLVKRAQEYIRAGDIFQVVLANRFFSSELVDPLLAFDALVQNNPSPYHFLVSFNGSSLVGASPETMLKSKRLGGGLNEVRMRLVAGTYPLAEALPHAQAVQLAADSKERAEHLMLVDHARNDIGRVARIGSVEVADLFSIESYADVHHLVSQVSGILLPGETPLSAMQSCFPIATLTGTPKIRAMEIIAELETPARGIFGGAVVLLGIDGSLDSTVAIRSLLTGPRGTSIQAGAGIVYDSDPEREFDECGWKAKALLDALR